MRDWGHVYLTIMNNEHLTIKQIQVIANVGPAEAYRINNIIRGKVINNGAYYPNRNIPTDLLLEFLEKDENYFWEKFLRQLEIEKMKQTNNFSFLMEEEISMKDWAKIYQTITDNDYLTVKQIALIAGVGQTSAIKIRDNIREKVLKDGKFLPNQQTPTNLLLEHLGKDEDYYWNRFKRQVEIINLKSQLLNSDE